MRARRVVRESRRRRRAGSSVAYGEARRPGVHVFGERAHDPGGARLFETRTSRSTSREPSAAIQPTVVALLRRGPTLLAALNTCLLTHGALSIREGSSTWVAQQIRASLQPRITGSTLRNAASSGAQGC